METLNELSKALPDIIKNASQSALGIFALLAIVVGGLAWGFFREASIRVRLATWLVILVGTVAFAIATANASHDPSTSPAIKATADALSLAGTTVDAASNRAVPQAQITLVGRFETAISDDNGNFRIEIKGMMDPQADVRLRVSKTGYDTYDSQVTAPLGGLIIPLHRAR